MRKITNAAERATNGHAPIRISYRPMKERQEGRTSRPPCTGPHEKAQQSNCRVFPQRKGSDPGAVPRPDPLRRTIGIRNRSAHPRAYRSGSKARTPGLLRCPTVTGVLLSPSGRLAGNAPKGDRAAGRAARQGVGIAAVKVVARVVANHIEPLDGRSVSAQGARLGVVVSRMLV